MQLTAFGAGCRKRFPKLSYGLRSCFANSAATNASRWADLLRRKVYKMKRSDVEFWLDGMIGFVQFIGIVIGSMLLVVTMPIWIIPYLVWKHYL